MKYLYRRFRLHVAATTLLTLFFGCLSAQPQLPGVVRIKVSEDLARKLEAQTHSANRAGQVVTGVASLDEINRQFAVRRFSRVFPPSRHEAKHRRHGLHLWYEIHSDKAIPVASILQSYRSQKEVLKAEPVYEKALIGSGTPLYGPAIVSTAAPGPLPEAANDPMLASQWHYHNTGQTGGTPGADIDLFDAWKTETGDERVIIAVTDGGVQTDHPDLAANLWINTREVAGNGVDDDHNGYVDDINGYGFVNNSAAIIADDHGTHVAGTIAAVSNNSVGVAGVAGGTGNGDGVRIMSCAVFNGDQADGFAQAYVYSADNGAVISQNSWGYTVPDVFEQVVLDAIDYFIAEAGKDETGKQTGPLNGGLVLFSAGNYNKEGNFYPAAYEPVVAVASSTHTDARARYSNFGAWVDITAPGGETYETREEGVMSTLADDSYGYFMGTSMACPHATGVAALLVSRYGGAGIHPEAIRRRLTTRTDGIEEINPDYAGKLGAGRLNAARALAADDALPPARVTDLSVSAKDVGVVTLTWTSPRDPGDFVAAYDLRYSTRPITAESFLNATAATDLPPPQPPGAPETFTLTRLPGGVTYYFALRARDLEGNTSALSNIISETTALTPELAVKPISIAADLETAGTTVRALTLANTGRGPLTFTVREAPSHTAFVTASTREGSLQPGASTKINVAFDAAGLYSGTYRQDLIIESNDPFNNRVVVPVTLTVTNNGAPIASLTPQALDFKSARTGTVVSRYVSIGNAGSGNLLISGVESGDPQFLVASPLPIEIQPFSSRQVRINFTPSRLGASTAELAIHTNDPHNPTLLLGVRGEGLDRSPVVITPNVLDETLPKGSTAARTLTVTNNGSQERVFRLEAKNTRLLHGEGSGYTRGGNGARASGSDRTSAARVSSLRARHQQQLSSQSPEQQALAKIVGPGGARTASVVGRQSSADASGPREIATGFEDFSTGPLAEQQGWYSTAAWMIAEENADGGARHLRGTSQATGNGEQYAVSPWLFEESYYPQYTTAEMRLNLDKAMGVTWEMVPQDPWSYVGTRIRFNADGSIEAMVIDSDYNFIWQKLPVSVPPGYFDLAVEYNGWGSDTSGFPTYQLFINNRHVFSGTGLGSGIGQVAFVSPMETSGPVMDIDDFRITGGEYIPAFVFPQPVQGLIGAGESVSVQLAFDASVMKYGTYGSDLVMHLDEQDSIVVPATLTVTGDGSLTRDLHAVEMELDANEEGTTTMTLKNDGGREVRYNLAPVAAVPGLTIAPASGVIPVRGEAAIQIRFQGVPGIYENGIALTSDTGDEPVTIPMKVVVFDIGADFSAPPGLALDVRYGEVTTRTFVLRNNGKNTVTFLTAIAGDTQHIGLEPASGTVTDSLVVTMTIDARALSVGQHRSTITFETNDPEKRRQQMPVTLNVLGSPVASGNIIREIWSGIPGVNIGDIPFAAPPARIETLALFQSPVNAGDNFGSRIRGYLQAPRDGYYTFWIASNDNSQLWLSTDGEPENKILIAAVSGYTNPLQWDKYASQRSEAIFLEANARYYIEAQHKEGTGTDHVAVGWQLPDGTFERPIPGMRLTPFTATPAPCAGSGTMVREQWDGISGTLISSIPLQSPPASTLVVNSFESPSQLGDNYGARIRGYICVPVSGAYTFWIASNDRSELWLSSDTRPENRVMIAHVAGYTGEREWTKYAAQQSASVTLEAGRKYYIEALHKQGVGSDHLAVGWQLPDGTLERPIPGPRLIPFEGTRNGAPGVRLTAPVEGQVVAAGSTVALGAEAWDNDGAITRVAFYAGDAFLGEDTSAPYTQTWTPSEAGAYALTAIATDDSASTGSSAPVNIVVRAQCTASGTIAREFWTGVSGGDVASIPFDTPPDGRQELVLFESPSNAGTHYGARLSGYVCPPETGDYYFWIASNDQSELWLSTDREPANRVKIAYVSSATGAREWDRYPSQRSLAVHLVQGKSYYVEALHKQGVGSDHLAVGWQLPDGTFERPIAGSRLSPTPATAAGLTSDETNGTAFTNEPDLHVFPNPLTGEQLNVVIENFSGFPGAAMEITIRQYNGVIAYQTEVSCAQECRTSINVAQHLHAAGLYMLQLRIGSKLLTRRLVVR